MGVEGRADAARRADGRRSVSDHGDEPADDTTPVFTQYEVFMVGGVLAELWGHDAEQTTDDVEHAIQLVLNRESV